MSLVKTNATKVAVVFIYSTVALAFLLTMDAVDWKWDSLWLLAPVLGHGVLAAGQ